MAEVEYDMHRPQSVHTCGVPVWWIPVEVGACFLHVVALGLHYAAEPDFTRRIPGLKIETWGTRPISFGFSRRL